MTSEEKKSTNKVKKSPSQLNRDKCRKQKFIENKSEAEVPSTDIKSDTKEPKEKAEKDLVGEVKKGLNVTDAEVEVTKFLDNLLKPKVPATNVNTREVKDTLQKGNLKCNICNFGGRNYHDLKKHVGQKHGDKGNHNAKTPNPSAKFKLKCWFDCGFSHEDREALCYHYWNKHNHLEP